MFRPPPHETNLIMVTVRLALVCVLGAIAIPASPGAERESGDLPGGGAFTALKPPAWSGDRLLIVAPPQRGEGQPVVPTVDEAHPLCRTLLQEGWMVAVLGYRRTGVVLRDGLEDLSALRVRLAQGHGAADRTYLLGEGLGGGIAVRAVEHRPDEFAGALVVGGPFDLQEPAPTVGVSFAPQRPLLLLPNRSEDDAPRTYARAAAGAADPPVVWTVGRDGRGNVRQVEKLAALAALTRWVEDGLAPRSDFDPTLPAPSRESEARFAADGSSAEGRVVAVDPVRGDLVLDLQPADLARLGVERGAFFALLVPGPSGADRLLRVLYGQNPRAARRGDWMALPEAEGGLLVFVYRGNAAAEAGLRVGAVVTVRRLRDD